MLTFVLEASSALRFVDNEAGSDRVFETLNLAASGVCQVRMSAVNWGEVVYILAGRKLSPASFRFFLDILEDAIEIVPASADRAAQAGMIKSRLHIPYADCFCVELASGSSESVLVTADFDLKPAENNIKIEFLPQKPKP